MLFELDKLWGIYKANNKKCPWEDTGLTFSINTTTKAIFLLSNFPCHMKGLLLPGFIKFRQVYSTY
jgi:hypothetical protein